MQEHSRKYLSLDAWVAERIRTDQGLLTGASIRCHQQRMAKAAAIRASKRSPFHRRLSGLDFDDWASLPFTTSEDLRNRGLQMLCTSLGEIGRVVTLETSGTTGTPKRIYFTQEDQENTVEFFRAGMGSFTAPGERVLILLPGDRTGSIGQLLRIALERWGAVPISHGSVRELVRSHNVLVESRAELLVGIPNQVLALARYSEAAGLAAEMSVRKVLLSTDRVSNAVIAELKRIWGCEVYRYYGMTEAGLGWGMECACHQGYHLYEADFLTEIIDPATGLPVPEGQEGEIVLTTLTRNGMPMLRYRTGDLSRFVPEPCPCGSMLRRLDTIRARVDGMISLAAGGTLTLGELDDALLDLPGILDFTAAFQTCREDDRLMLRAEFLGEAPPPEAVIQRIAGISVLQMALQTKRLRLDVVTVSWDASFIPAIGKRKILMHREELKQGTTD